MKKYLFLAALMLASTPVVMASDLPQNEEPNPEQAVTATAEHTAGSAAEVAVKKRVVSMQEMRSALRSGKPALQKLIEEGADINAKDPRTGLTLLHEAASEGNVARLQTLHEVGADMNMQNNQGATALHMASRVGHIKAAQKLVDLGVKTDIKNNQGLTAHAVAHANSNKPITAILENHPK